MMITLNERQYCSTLEEAIEKEAAYEQLSSKLKRHIDNCYGKPTQPLCPYHYLLMQETWRLL